MGKNSKYASRFCVLALSVALVVPAHGSPDEKDKLEEGKYGLLTHGRMVPGSEHSWKLWRLPDGRLELEDHFEINKETRALMYAIPLAAIDRVAPELRESLESGVFPNQVTAILDGDGRQILSLTATGLKFNNSTAIGLKCTAEHESVECAGTAGKAKIRKLPSSGLFWWFDIPPLLSQWLSADSKTQPSIGPANVVLLSFGFGPKNTTKAGEPAGIGARAWWGEKPALESVDLTRKDLGPDTLTVGDHAFHVNKTQIDLSVTKGDPISLTVWTDAKGVVVGVADSNTPDYLVALLEYKRYPAAAQIPAKPNS